VLCSQHDPEPRSEKAQGFFPSLETIRHNQNPAPFGARSLRRAKAWRSVDVNGDRNFGFVSPLTEVEQMTEKAIVGEKVGMTQVWDDENNIVPVTVVKITPCRVTQIKSPETDGYSAIQVTVGTKDAAKLSQPEAGHFAKHGVAPGVGLVELRFNDVSSFTVGQELTAELFEAGDLVDVVGISKGQGFTGVMKRHNFSGQRATHGAHLVHRMPGSIGQCATPSRVFKGQRMAGHSGNQRTTTQNLKIVRADAEQNLILVKGSVPGAKGGQVVLRNAVKVSV
jgi:large subunit ribosomal protein L3